jgi:3',5'-cyclic AMP phosphodiesterase CpdA
VLTIAHLTDTHFGNRPGVADRNRRVAESVARIAPDVVVVTGDVADHGRAEEYAEALDVYADLPAPVLWGTGNHDVREPFAEAFFGLPTGEPLNAEYDVAGVRFLMLDSLVPAPPGERIDHGELAQPTLDWLDAELASSLLPTFVCWHHPPRPVGVPWMDSILLRDPDALERVLAAHSHVVASLVGHVHMAVSTTFAGRPLLVGGGVSSTIPLEGEDLPRIWLDAPPTYAIHLLDVHDGNRVLTTHWRAL